MHNSPTESKESKIANAVLIFRHRFRASMTNALSSFTDLARQLDSTPNAPAVLDTVRRELHRIHGTGGTFGYTNASACAREMEQRALDWVANPQLDNGERGTLLRHFVAELERALEVDEATAPETLSSGGQRTSALTSTAEVATNAESHYMAPSRTTSPAPASNTVAPADLPLNNEVIVVEDDRALSDMLRYALESNGFTVNTFMTGPDALHTLLTKKPAHPTLVLLDVDLPGIDGHSIHERLRVQCPGTYAIVFISARGSEGEQLRAFKAGAIDYLVKPTSLRVLLAKVPIWLAMMGRTR